MRVNPRVLLLVAASLLGAAGTASAQPRAGAVPATPTPASHGDPLDICLGYLAGRSASLGLAADDVDALVVRNRYVTARTGVTHLYLIQQIHGIDVFNAGVTAAVDASGRVVALGERLVRNLSVRATDRPPEVSAEEAVAAAAAHLGLESDVPLSVRRRRGGPARRVVFEAGVLSRDDIPVALEFVPTDFEVRLAWNVVIRTPGGRHWWNLHVDAETGAVLRQDDWIDRDTYRAFAAPQMSPDSGPRNLLVNPADANASPLGWHDTDGTVGAEFTDTRGNNVFAQEDADADDLAGYRPDGGAGLDFDFPLDLAQQPSGYRDASVTNLFTWNNFVHDVMYHYGFDEPAGNFQENNYGNGGAAGDPVQADAQDGADVGNAQFGTPPDGTDPRMEMFRWEVGEPPRLDVESPAAISGAYGAGKALFGEGTTGLTGDVALALDPADAAGPATTDACSPLTNAGAVSGHIALIDRGECTFVVKVANAQAAGAIGAIIANNQGESLVTMVGVDPSLVIPSLFVSQSTGAAIAAELAGGVSATLISPADRDSALDSGVIVHEYGHGVSNRLTGGPANVSCLDAAESQGMGEGWSDWWALVFTATDGDAPEDARPMGTYLLGEPPSGPGIRNFPYSTDLGVSPRTYGDISSVNRPHGVGEVWAASLWEMYWNLVAVYGFDPDLIGGDKGNNLALALVMDGLKLQPCDPTFVEARDAILAADSVANAAANRCLIWSGFAKRGVGVSASDGGSPNNLKDSEAFDIPAECQPTCGDGLLQVGETCDDGNTLPGDDCSDTCQFLPEPDGTAMLVAGVAFLLASARRRTRSAG